MGAVLVIAIGLLVFMFWSYLGHIHDHITHIEDHICDQADDPHQNYWKGGPNA